MLAAVPMDHKKLKNLTKQIRRHCFKPIYFETTSIEVETKLSFAFDTTEKKICLVATHNNTAELDQDFCVNVQYTHRNDLMDIL